MNELNVIPVLADSNPTGWTEDSLEAAHQMLMLSGEMVDEWEKARDAGTQIFPESQINTARHLLAAGE